MFLNIYSIRRRTFQAPPCLVRQKSRQDKKNRGDSRENKIPLINIVMNHDGKGGEGYDEHDDHRVFSRTSSISCAG